MSRRPLRPPELSELAAFVAAVDEGSLAAAARRLHLTGPAIAKRIRNLETLSGRQLLERSERGVRPTAEGRSMLVAASRILAEVRALVPEDDDESGLRIGGIQELIGSARALPASEVMLHETETLFSQVFHTSPDAIVVSNPTDGRMIEVNDAFCRLSGYTREELRGRSSIEVGLWGDLEARDEIVARLQRERVARGVSPLRCKDGSELDAEFVAHLMRLRADEVLLIRMTDVSQRLRVARLAEVHARRHERLNRLGAVVLAGGTTEEVGELVVELVAEELGGSVALVSLSEPPEAVAATAGAGPRLSGLVADLGAAEGEETVVRLYEGCTVVARKIPASGGVPVVLVVETDFPVALDQDAIGMLASAAMLYGVSLGWRRSGELVVGLLGHASDAVLLVDNDGCVLSANPAARALLGRDPAASALTDVLALPGDPEVGWPRQLRDGAADVPASALRPDGTAVELVLQASGDLTPGRHLVVLAAAGSVRLRPRRAA